MVRKGFCPQYHTLKQKGGVLCGYEGRVDDVPPQSIAGLLPLVVGRNALKTHVSRRRCTSAPVLGSAWNTSELAEDKAPATHSHCICDGPLGQDSLCLTSSCVRAGEANAGSRPTFKRQTEPNTAHQPLSKEFLLTLDAPVIARATLCSKTALWT